MDDQEEHLISYVNLRSGLFTHQNNFLDQNNFKKLKFIKDNNQFILKLNK